MKSRRIELRESILKIMRRSPDYEFKIAQINDILRDFGRTILSKVILELYKEGMVLKTGPNDRNAKWKLTEKGKLNE